MQYLTREIFQFQINPELKIILKEYGGSLSRNDFFIEAKEYGRWTPKPKHYTEHFDIDNYLNIIYHWLDKHISAQEVKKLLNNLATQ